jgi:hypothetical protein
MADRSFGPIGTLSVRGPSGMEPRRAFSRPAAMHTHHRHFLPAIRRGLPFVAGILIVACTAGPAATPTVGPTTGPTAAPTGQPSAPPTPPPETTPPSPSVTSGPSASPSTAPSTSPSEPSGAPSGSPVPIGKVDHPTDPNAVVLRVDHAGGFINPDVLLLGAPPFTLYGDNSVVFRPTTDPTGTGLPPFKRAQLSVDQVDALLTNALVRDHLKDAEEAYPGNPDAGSTILSIDAGGVKKQVTFSASGPGTIPTTDVLKGLSNLANTLTDFESQVKAGKVLSVETYQPPMYRAILRQGTSEKPTVWPWTDLAIADFSASPDNGQLMGELTAAQAAKVIAVPSGGALDVGLLAPNGTAYLLSLRPVLPGEVF